MSKLPKDRFYRKPQSELVDFVFDHKVTSVFPDMIRRSVPGYDALISLLGLFAETYVTDNSSIYDLGCSTGATSLALVNSTRASGCRLVAVDNSQPMTEQCKKNLAALNEMSNNIKIDVVHTDILDIEICDASLVALNFTLQFISPSERANILKNIYVGLQSGGALILSEKIISPHLNQNEFHQKLHQRFKSANGYSDLEISQKRTALENVLIPDSLQSHLDRLRQAGFTEVIPWFQCFNFVSIVAIK